MMASYEHPLRGSGLCRFSCNGGRKHSAHEMSQIGTYNALIGEAAFYSAKHTGVFDACSLFLTDLGPQAYLLVVLGDLLLFKRRV